MIQICPQLSEMNERYATQYDSDTAQYTRDATQSPPLIKCLIRRF